MRRPHIAEHRRLTEWRWGAPVAVAALALIIGQAALASWVHAHLYWFGDDVMLLAQGASFPIGDSALLLQPWGGHFMPAAFLLAQEMARTAGFSYPIAILHLVLGQMLLNVLCLRMLVRHFGLRWRIMLPLALVITSIAILQATSWWAASINMLPMLACAVLIVDRLLSWLAHHSTPDLVWLLALFVTALLMFEKSILLGVMVIGFTFALRPERRWPEALRSAVLGEMRLWIPLAAVSASWFLLYRANDTATFARAPGLDRMADVGGIGLVSTTLTSLFGGFPNWTSELNQGNSLMAAPTWFVVLTGQIVVITVAITSLRSSRAARLWLVDAAYLSGLSLALAAGRSNFLPFTVSLPRYFADLVVVFSLTLALVLMRRLTDPSGYEPRLPDSGARRGLLVVGGVVAANLLVVNYVRTSVALTDAIAPSVAKPYLEQARRDLQSLGPGRTVLDLPAPYDTLGIAPSIQDHYSWIFAPVPGGPTYSPTADELLVIGDDGHVGPGILEGPTSIPGSQPCGHSSSDPSFVIPMKVQIFPWGHVMRIDYQSTVDTAITIEMHPGDPVDVPIRSGSHSVYVSFSGGGSLVHIQQAAPFGSVCINSLTIGQPVPAPSASPAPAG